MKTHEEIWFEVEQEYVAKYGYDMAMNRTHMMEAETQERYEDQF